MPGRELSLSSPPGFRLPELGGFDAGARAAPPQDLQFQTIYFDTADLRLARAGGRVRYRSDEGWTVALPPGEGGDVPVEHRFDGDHGSPPELALDLVTAYTRDRSLEPVARLRTARRRVPLLALDGTTMGEVVEDEVSVLEGVHLAARYREVEIGVSGDAPAGLAEAVAERLRAAGAGPPDPTPKIVRALGWRALEAPDVAPVPVDRSSTAGEAVRAAIAASVLRLVLHDPGVRLGQNPEDVHQARVATRRLRSDLRTFRSLLDAEWTSSLRDELRWLGQELGAVRDTEVLLDRMRDRIDGLRADDQSDAKPILQRLSERWESCRADLLDAIRSGRYLQLLERLVHAIHEPALLPEADAPAADALPALVRGPWQHLKSAVDALGDDPVDEVLHEVRIRAKRCRYASEAVAPVVGKAAREFARAVASVQEVLGEHQDAVVAEAWLRETARTADGREVFVAGELAAFEIAASRDARDRWRGTWRDASRKRHRNWL